jgi:dienelactone hydrolase
MKKFIVFTCILALSVLVSLTAIAQQAPSAPFAQRTITFTNGITGKPLTFESANPRNYEDVIGKLPMPAIKLDGQLFVPKGAGPFSIVILTPGSGGVSPDHLNHAEALTSAGLAVYVLDPFTGRGVKETGSDQTQFSFAASAYDILAAARMLATQPNLDKKRMGILGYSRGGAAVLTAISQQMSQAVLGGELSFKAALVGWAWCGHQFEQAITAPTVVRFLLGDSDSYVSPVQCQGQASAMAATNPRVSVRLFKDAQHGFGYSMPITELPDAIKAFNCPIVYFNDKGQFLDSYTGEVIPGADDKYYLTRYAARWVTRGASYGTKPGQKEAFLADTVGFFKENLKR